jgi:[protein-PII] uridylyltransferase
MHRYGILAKYIPEFAPLVGQMQFDMFHVYTVDQHTIFVVRNLRRLMDLRFAHELPFVSKIMRGIEHEWLIIIAGLFHDIGKGKGGDHSIIGAEYVRAFGIRLGLSSYQVEFISWLVASHLLMSMTAQKKDIDDPRVIAEFAETVETKERLDYLYLLTVADIRGTNPELWNGWKEALLERLYRHTVEALRRPSVITIQKKAMQVQEEAKQLLQQKYEYSEQEISNLWQRFDNDYFCRFSASEIAWHSAAILEKTDRDQTVVLSRYDAKRGGNEIMIYAFDKPRLFAAIATVLAKMQLNIYDARVTSSYHRLVNGIEQNYALNSYTVLGSDDEVIVDESYLKQITDEVYAAVNALEDIRIGGFKSVHRSIRIMDKSLRLVFDIDKNTSLTTLDLKAPDTPGLLAMVGLAFTKHQVQIHNARISTLGDKAQDIFWISDMGNAPLTETAQIALQQQIIEELSELYGWDVNAEDNELSIIDVTN